VRALNAVGEALLTGCPLAATSSFERAAP